MLDGRFFFRPMVMLDLMIDFLVILSVRTVQSVIFIYRQDSYTLLVHFYLFFPFVITYLWVSSGKI
jgi:hypothetical protein